MFLKGAEKEFNISLTPFYLIQATSYFSAIHFQDWGRRCLSAALLEGTGRSTPPPSQRYARHRLGRGGVCLSSRSVWYSARFRPGSRCQCSSRRHRQPFSGDTTAGQLHKVARGRGGRVHNHSHKLMFTIHPHLLRSASSLSGGRSAAILLRRARLIIKLNKLDQSKSFIIKDVFGPCLPQVRSERV